jgi:Fe2+ transport system protein FeoA
MSLNSIRKSMPTSPRPEPTLLPLTDAVPLRGLPRGAHVRIVRVDADCDDAARLKALGVCVGRRLHVIKSGDPMIIRVIGARIGLAAGLAAAVWVDSPLSAQHPETRPVRAAV